MWTALGTLQSQSLWSNACKRCCLLPCSCAIAFDEAKWNYAYNYTVYTHLLLVQLEIVLYSDTSKTVLVEEVE